MKPILTALLLVPMFAIGQILPSVAQEVQDPPVPEILSMRDRAALQDEWLAERLDTVVPMLMRREGIDMWIMTAREYNEDPVVLTMLPGTWIWARRRTILVFFDPGEGKDVERFAVSRYPIGTFFKAEWSPEEQPDQWARLSELIAERDPDKIGISISREFPLADGLTASEHVALLANLPTGYRERLVSAEKLAVGWLETRIPGEMEMYPTIVRIAHAILAEGLSEKVITPGETTVEDVAWWYRDRIRELKLVTWFHPGVSLERQVAGKTGTPPTVTYDADRVILPGDFLHVDFGIRYLGLHTDTQHHAYVLKDGETEAPKGLRDGLAAANRIQDVLLANYKVGITGNDALRATRRITIAEGLRPSVYTHPIGFQGHAAGPAIGMWDNQNGIKKGDALINANTAWSIELNATHAVPEWGGQELRFKTEEDAFFDGEKVTYIDGRQTEVYLIPRQ